MKLNRRKQTDSGVVDIIKGNHNQRWRKVGIIDYDFIINRFGFAF